MESPHSLIALEFQQMVERLRDKVPTSIWLKLYWDGSFDDKPSFGPTSPSITARIPETIDVSVPHAPQKPAYS